MFLKKWRKKKKKPVPVRSWVQARSKGAVPDPARGVEVIGDIGADVGLGESARALIRAMNSAGLPVKTTEIVTHPQQRSETKWEQEVGLSGCVPDYVLLHLNGDASMDMALRQTKASFLDRARVIGYWYWELPDFPVDWLDRTRYLDEIWVASTYVQENLSGQVNIPVLCLPPPVVVPAAVPARERFGFPSDRFLFAFTFNPTSSVARKNPFAVVEAFKKAFQGRQTRPLLVLKTHHLNLLEGKSELEQELREALDSVGGKLITENWDRQTMGDFLCSCDAYVSLHRAEGLGLGLAESMLYGKPVIGTGFSGNMDFMNSGNSYPVAYDDCRIQPEDHRFQPAFKDIYQPGQQWAEPDLDHAAFCMARVVDFPEEASGKGLKARKTIGEKYSPAVRGEAIRKRLDVLAGSAFQKPGRLLV